MKARDFCFWLQGYFELTGATNGLDNNQLCTIRRHLELVFTHDIDPSMGDSAHQYELNTIHDGATPLPYPAASPFFEHFHPGRPNGPGGLMRC